MKKLLLTLASLSALAGCAQTSDGVTTNDDVICYGDYSYLKIDGDVVPSPSTLAGDIDVDCYLPS